MSYIASLAGISSLPRASSVAEGDRGGGSLLRISIESQRQDSLSRTDFPEKSSHRLCRLSKIAISMASTTRRVISQKWAFFYGEPSEGQRSRSFGRTIRHMRIFMDLFITLW